MTRKGQKEEKFAEEALQTISNRATLTSLSHQVWPTGLVPYSVYQLCGVHCQEKIVVNCKTCNLKQISKFKQIFVTLYSSLYFQLFNLNKIPNLIFESLVLDSEYYL